MLPRFSFRWPDPKNLICFLKIFWRNLFFKTSKILRKNQAFKNQDCNFNKLEIRRGRGGLPHIYLILPFSLLSLPPGPGPGPWARAQGPGGCWVPVPVDKIYMGKASPPSPNPKLIKIYVFVYTWGNGFLDSNNVLFRFGPGHVKPSTDPPS